MEIIFNGAPYVLTRGEYPNGRIALILQSLEIDAADEDDDFITATVNLPDYHIPWNEVFIKDWGGQEGMVETLARKGIILSAHAKVKSGFVNVSLCKLLIDTDKLELVT